MEDSRRESRRRVEERKTRDEESGEGGDWGKGVKEKDEESGGESGEGRG